MDPRQSAASLQGCTPIEGADRGRNVRSGRHEEQSRSHEEHTSRRDLTSLYAALEHDAIAALAHRYWQERGCPVGSAAEDWFRAEQEFHHRLDLGHAPDYVDEGIVLRLPH